MPPPARPDPRRRRERTRHDTTRAHAFGLWRALVPARSSYGWSVGLVSSRVAASRPGGPDRRRQHQVGGELGASELKESGAELFSPAGRRRLRLAALSTDALALAHSSACWYYDKRHVSACQEENGFCSRPAVGRGACQPCRPNRTGASSRRVRFVPCSCALNRR